MNLNHYPIDQLEVGYSFQVPCALGYEARKLREVEVDMLSVRAATGYEFRVERVGWQIRVTRMK